MEVAKEMITESPAIAESVGPRGAAGPAGVDGAQGPSGNAGAPGPVASQAEAAPAGAPSPPVAAQSAAPAPTAAPVREAQGSGGGKSNPGLPPSGTTLVLPPSLLPRRRFHLQPGHRPHFLPPGPELG